MQDIKFKTLMKVLKNDDNTPFTKYTVEDCDGNQIRAEDLFVLDYIQIGDWPVTDICVDDFGRVTIVLNGGNFNSFHLRSVR